MKKLNKGFSLVELIIVIAIMAILIGVLAPQYMKYVEKSRVSADKDLADSVYNACTTAAADPDNATSEPGINNNAVSVTAGSSWDDDVLSTLGVSAFTDVEAKLKSKSFSGQNINITTDSLGNFTVSISSAVPTTPDLVIPEK